MKYYILLTFGLFLGINCQKGLFAYDFSWDPHMDSLINENNVHMLPSVKPDRIILHPSETPYVSVGVNFRTSVEVKEAFLEFAIASAGPEFRSKTRRIGAETSYLKTKHDGEPEIEAHYHEVNIEGLKPGEDYVYRVGTEKAWSEWFQFEMPKQEEPVQFVFFGDAQNDVLSMWSRVIRETYFQFPRVDFMIYAGDLINREEADFEWGGWFEAGGFIHSSTPILMSPGNHEYAKAPVTLSKHWNPQFNLPKNGPEGMEEVVYEVNYKDLKVISLDAELIDEIPDKRTKQVQWLRKVLKNDPKKWTVITFHYPIYSTKPNRNNEDMQDFIRPIIEEFNVDLVLQGHDHAYARGRMLYNGGNEILGEGPMYVVSVSGPKMYDIGDEAWMDRKAYNTQLFHWVEVSGNKLEFKAFTATGELYDAFDLEKEASGKNQLVNHIPRTTERIQAVK
ncbi:purple acid phosphatase family protein [Echinicola shivajiensis]|uniref:purple acid phosphatase family protein n=1 Tax=Echinicola shivajiensis TaxID=1035916 RepID=UPI001FE38342|nr:metallophosphoesterase family protein [Echinicola shivajiensis]